MKCITTCFVSSESIDEGFRICSIVDLNYTSGKKFIITDTGTCERFSTYIVGERQGFNDLM